MDYSKTRLHISQAAALELQNLYQSFKKYHNSSRWPMGCPCTTTSGACGANPSSVSFKVYCGNPS